MEREETKRAKTNTLLFVLSMQCGEVRADLVKRRDCTFKNVQSCAEQLICLCGKADSSEMSFL